MNKHRRDQALTAVRELTVESEDLARRVDIAVARAVHWGATWRQVGDMLGVTPQAAHKRYRSARYDPTTGLAWHEPPLPI